MNFTVAIADDDCIICDGIKAILQSAIPKLNIIGMFYNGNDLLEYLTTAHVDIVICDIQMPGSSGIDISKYLHEHSPETKIILITGHKVFEYAKSAIDNKVCNFLTKPYNPEELIDIVKAIIVQLESNIDYVNKNTVAYLNNWYHLKSSIIQMIDTGEKDKNFDKDMFCTYTKFADQLKIKRIKFEAFNVYNFEELGDYDSIFLSSFVIAEYKNGFTCIILYDSEEAVDNYLLDMQKYAKTIGISITIKRISQYKDINELLNSQNDEDYENNDIVKLAVEYIDQNYHNSEISLGEIASKLYISKNYLGTLFRIRNGVSYNTYLMKVRINKAKELLQTTNMSISKICTNVGITNIDYFRINFKKIVKVSPSEYRKRYIKGSLIYENQI